MPILFRRRAALFLIFTLSAVFAFCSCSSDAPVSGETSDTTEPVTETAAEAVTAAEDEENVDKTEAAGPVNPLFSQQGGIYGDYITLELSIPDGAEGVYAIRYTTNGDDPTAASTKYDAPIVLLAAKESVVVRAACFSRSGTILGNIVTNTYIKDDGGRYSTMIVSISCDDGYLNGPDGIITNPTNSGVDWERPAHVEILNNDGTRVIDQDAGLRIFGGSSRVLAQKSFRLIAREARYYTDIRYSGASKFDYPLFDNAYHADGSVMESFDRLVLRNGGNDSLQAVAADPREMNLLRDGIVNNFAVKAAMAVTSQESRMVVVFLNGQYYGLLDLKVDINDDYIADYYGIADKNAITVIKSELDTTRHCSVHSNGGSCRFCNVWFYYEVDNGEESELDALTSLLQKAIDATDADYDSVYAEIAGSIDLDNFMQYMALNLYVCNTDWPHNNIRVWRYNGEYDASSPYTDGKWRFTTRDEDFAFGRYECLVLPEIYTMADTDTFERMLGNYWNGSYNYDASSGLYPDSLLIQGLGDFCLKNDEFRASFEAYCRSLVSDDNIALLRSLMDDYVSSVQNEIGYHIDRWKDTIDSGYTTAAWKSSVDRMYVWLDERPVYFLEYLENALSKYEP